MKRVALVAGGTLAPVLPKLGERFVAAELEHFEPGDFEKALAWAKAA